MPRARSSALGRQPVTHERHRRGAIFGVDGGLADGVGPAAAATDSRPEPLPDTVTTRVCPRRAQVRALGGRRVWPASIPGDASSARWFRHSSWFSRGPAGLLRAPG
jgi:hypothetical protein